MQYFDLTGSRNCVGCGGLTFRNRRDGLCPRCAYHAEHLIEQIELETLERDLALLTRFDAYCADRDRQLHPAPRADQPEAQPEPWPLLARRPA